MEQPTLLPPPDELVVELTPNFADNKTIAEAIRLCGNRQAVLYVWSSIARKVLSTGTHTKHTGKINDLNKRVGMPTSLYDGLNKAALEALRSSGALVARDYKAVESELDESHFNVFWQIYPSRKGTVKVGKANTRREFAARIRSQADHAALMAAVVKYKSMTNREYVKDPERFLKNDFWRDWIPDTYGDATAPELQTPKTFDNSSIDTLLGR
jgi:hypothetical protein